MRLLRTIGRLERFEDAGANALKSRLVGLKLNARKNLFIIADSAATKHKTSEELVLRAFGINQSSRNAGKPRTWSA